MVSERGFCHQLFSPKDKGKCKVGRGAAGWDLGRGGSGGREGKEKQVASTREREQISKPNIPREEKKKGESKTTGAQLFSSFSFSSFFFFSVLERVAKHDFYGIVLQSGSVKSSQVRQEEQGEQSEREEGEGEGGRGRQGLSVRVRMFLCVFCERERVCVCTKVDLGRREICCLCVCVYVQRGPSPTPQVNVGFFARNYYRLFFLRLLMCILIL